MKLLLYPPVARFYSMDDVSEKVRRPRVRHLKRTLERHAGSVRMPAAKGFEIVLCPRTTWVTH